MQTLSLELIGPADGVDVAPLQRVMQVAIQRSEELGLPLGIINLSFVDDMEITRLNRDYSGNDYATDVLSFNYLESGDAIDGVIGEMAISLDTATRQAAEAGTPLNAEVALLALHGLLHISGYDHQDEVGRERMQETQRALLNEAGVPYREFIWQD